MGLPDLNKEDSLMAFLQAPTLQIAEVLTGILASDQKDWKLSAGKIIQAAIKGNLLTQIGTELSQYRSEGKIKEDYFATNKSRATLYELLKFLDEEVPDEELFKAIKSIFFTSVSTGATEEDEALGYEFIQTAKKLSGTEILILRANYELVMGKINVTISREALPHAQSLRPSWRRIVAIQMGYGEMFAIVGKYEQNLESLGLISPRHADTRFPDNFEPTSMYRMTPWGVKFCEFISNF